VLRISASIPAMFALENPSAAKKSEAQDAHLCLPRASGA